jgi:hypothetical protein
MGNLKSVTILPIFLKIREHSCGRSNPNPRTLLADPESLSFHVDKTGWLSNIGNLTRFCWWFDRDQRFQWQ